MKTTKKISRKHFRYLSKKDIKNPLLKVAEFCRSWTSLEGYIDDVKRLISANKSDNPEQLSTMELSNLLFDAKLTLTNIELLYVLRHTIDSWKLDKSAPYYTVKITAMGAFIEDGMLTNSQEPLLFARLTKAETKNIGRFIERFFRLLSLREWQQLMDDLQEDFFSIDNLSSLILYQYNFRKIYKYLKKLPEAFFFIYATKAKEHIFKHHVKEFSLEKHVDKQPATPEITPNDDVPADSPDSESTAEANNKNT